MSRSRRRAWVFPAALGLGLLAGAGAAHADAECVGPEPMVVLSCIESAYQHRDFAAYQALLAEDFEYVTYADTARVGGWDRAKDLESTKKLFQRVEVRSIKLRFDRTTAKATELSTEAWVLGPLPAHLALEVKADGQVKRYDVDNPDFRLFVRRVAEPTPHFEIYRWEEHEPAE